MQTRLHSDPAGHPAQLTCPMVWHGALGLKGRKAKGVRQEVVDAVALLVHAPQVRAPVKACNTKCCSMLVLLQSAACHGNTVHFHELGPRKAGSGVQASSSSRGVYHADCKPWVISNSHLMGAATSAKGTTAAAAAAGAATSSPTQAHDPCRCAGLEQGGAGGSAHPCNTCEGRGGGGSRQL
jgi:hypothetical protein